jgi:hypothetical protein
MRVAWQRLIRFQAADGRILQGEPILSKPDLDLGYVTEKDRLQARVIVGDDILDETGVTRVSDEIVTVRRILSPLAPSDVPTIRCVGLNYLKHSKREINQPAGTFRADYRSPASKADAAALSLHLLQTPDDDIGPRRQRGYTKDCPG